MVQVIENSEDYKKALKSKVAIIDCYAVWCGPCKVISPVFEKLSREVKGVEFFKLDVDEVPSVVAELGVRAMPTFLFFENGVKVNEFVGANPKGLMKLITAYQEKPKAEEEKPKAKEEKPGAEEEKPKAEEEKPKVEEKPKAEGETASSPVTSQ
ncbi:thioredoxin-domain-containing protein [Tuber magnatum]|uniref:Thioredoxin-domain-containing protein n=1 Tax=Tuber magnatum TaxID=42249 RepID=A0A317STK0_9PEZI|nr:thioredoxin-domain-containing protein [Tuber magnatum]